MDNEKLTEKIYSFEGDIREVKVTQKEQAEDIAEIKQLLKDIQRKKDDDLTWVKRQVLGYFIGGIMVLLSLGFGVYNMKQINEAKTVIQQYE